MTAVLRARTAGLKRQHEAAPALIARYVTRIADMGELPSRADAYQVTLLLAKLAGMLRIHFAQEDNLLYPALMESPSAHVATTARAFFEDIGQIGPAFVAYVQRWCATEAILADPAGFRRETEAQIATLTDRISREDRDLYPLADALYRAEEAREGR